MSAIMDNEIFGWNLLYEMNKDFITSKYDIMVAVVHWALIKKGFRCVGLGDNHNIIPNLELSECLPTGWTKMEFHKLRYIYNFELYILSSAKDMKDFCVNLTHPYDLTVTIINLKYDIITGVTGTLEEIMPDYINVLREINSTLIYPFVKNYFIRNESTQASAINIALDNTPRELEPIVRIFKTTPMERTLSGAKLNDILNRFEEAIRYIRNPLLLSAEEITNNERISYQEDDDNNGPGSQQGDSNFNLAGGQFVPENQVGDNGLGPHDVAGEGSQADSRTNELLEGVEKYANLTREQLTKLIEKTLDTDAINLDQYIINKSSEANVGQSTGEENISTAFEEKQEIKPAPYKPDNLQNLSGNENKSTGNERKMETKNEKETDNELAKRRQELLNKLDPVDLHLMENMNISKTSVCHHPHGFPPKRLSNILQSESVHTKTDSEMSSTICACCNKTKCDFKIEFETENQTNENISGNIGQYLEPQPIEPENRRDDLELEGAVGGLSISESINVDEQDEDLEEIKIDFEDECCVKCLMK